MPKSPEEMAAAMVANLPEKTGKSLQAWLKIVAAAGPAKHGEIVKLLKSEHGVTHGYANLIAHEALKAARPADDSDDDPVAAQYAGPKQGLRAIYDAVIAAVGAFGGDVEIAPKKTYVSLRRRKQFALVQASTRTRVDVGINLAGAAPTARLEASGSFNAMVSHRVRLERPQDVDRELVRWLKQAYEKA